MDWSGFCSSRCQTSRKSLRHLNSVFPLRECFFFSLRIRLDHSWQKTFRVQDNLLVASNETPPLLPLTALIGWVESPLSLASSGRGSFQDGRGKCPSWTLSFFSFFVLAVIDSSFKTIMRTKSTDLMFTFPYFHLWKLAILAGKTFFFPTVQVRNALNC